MRRTFFLSLILLSVCLLPSCDVSGFLYTQSELADMYTIDIALDDQALAEYAIIDNTIPLTISLLTEAGAPEPAILNLQLFDANDELAGTISFATAQGSRSAGLPESTISVRSFSDELPSVSLPSDLLPGYYRMHLSIEDVDGRPLTSLQRHVLIYNVAAPEIRVSLFPASIGANQQAIVKASFDGIIADTGWLRWIIDDELFAAGPISHKTDRIVWETGAGQAIHSIVAEYFPFEPPQNGNTPAFARCVIKAPVSQESVQNPPYFPDDGANFVAFRNGILQDTAPANQLTAITGTGLVYPETNPHGFGLALGPDGSLSAPYSFLPLPDSEADLGFAMAFTLDPLPDEGFYSAAGQIFSLLDAQDQAVLELGVEDGFLYLLTDSLSVSTTPLANETLAIVINAQPANDRLSLEVSVNGTPVLRHDSADFRRVSTVATSRLGGEKAFMAVYDEIVFRSGALPARGLHLARFYGRRFIGSFDFDNGSQTRAAQPGLIADAGGDQLAYPELFSLAWPSGESDVAVQVDFAGAVPRLQLAAGQAGIIAILPDGSVDFGGQVIGKLVNHGHDGRLDIHIPLIDQSIQLANAFSQVDCTLTDTKAELGSIRLLGKAALLPANLTESTTLSNLLLLRL